MVRFPCCVCAAPIIVDDEVDTSLRGTGRSFFCLNGHSQTFRPTTQEKEIARLKKELDEATATASRVKREAALEKNVCPDCAKRFDSPGALKAHRTRVHRHLKALPENAGKSN